jgi:hypothetical protein
MSTVGDRIVEFARQQIGEPYVWGAEGPDSWDCSGLVYGAMKAAGLDVTRTTAANLGRQGSPVELAAAMPGDVVYYDRPGATDHVGLYIGNGQMINAPQAGQPVSVASVGSPTSIRRMPGVDGPASPWGDFAGTSTSGSATAEESGGILGVFSGWADDLRGVAMKVVAASAVAALVIVGAKATLQDRKA